jgi:thioredoxin-like negative regulator of GroEL
MSAVVDYTSRPIPTGSKVVLLFWAPWHEASVEGGPMDTLLKALSSSSSKVLFGRVQAEENPDLVEKYEVTAVPTFVLLNEAGEVVETVEGGDDVSQVTQAVQ